jgi:TPR repeat protein
MGARSIVRWVAGVAVVLQSFGSIHAQQSPSSSTVQQTLQAAAAGDAQAMCGVGVMYFTGSGLPRDLGQAMTWFQRSAAAGNASAMQNLGFMYANGAGVPRDFTQAMNWFQKAADLGDAGSMNFIGVMYDKGAGVPRDDAQAMVWFRKAADTGFPPSMPFMGSALLSSMDDYRRMGLV